MLLESDDPFLRYSAYLDVYSNITNALHDEDPELLSTIPTDKRIIEDRRSYSRFFDKYRESVAADIAGSINNSYLQANGQVDGTKTYGMITEMVCAYVLNIYKSN